MIPGIEAKNIAGNRGIELLRRDLEDEVEFITIMTFDSLQSVIDFQGEDYQRCYVPDAAQRVWSQQRRLNLSLVPRCNACTCLLLPHGMNLR